MDDVLLLSRIQFAGTIMFHYLFPPLTIGLGLVMVFLEGNYLRTRDPIYEVAAKFWTKIFGICFAIGVASGIVMVFQFGTNWSGYSRYVGDVFGSALAAEGVFAFFLESGFLAILLFGWDRVSAGFHFFATCMVFLGSIFSSIWITVANSWQQTPAGSHIVQMMRNSEPWVLEGKPVMRAEIVNFWEVVFNPSTVDRLVHVWLGAFILGTFFIMSISAWYLLKNKHVEFARRSFTGALTLATIVCLLQLASGHHQAQVVAEYQPAKLAAFEGLYETAAEGEGSPLYAFGWVNDEAKTVTGLKIPKLLSFLVHSDFTTPVPGFDRLEKDFGKPPMQIAFQSYHLMVGIGMTFIGSTVLACLLWWRGVLWNQRWLLWFFVLAVLPAFAGNQFGWISAEVGRQPWIVYPMVRDGQIVMEGMRTANAVSPNLDASQVLASIVMFGLIYVMLFVVWVYVLNHKIQSGPEPVTPAGGSTGKGLMDAASKLAGRKESMTSAKG